MGRGSLASSCSTARRLLTTSGSLPSDSAMFSRRSGETLSWAVLIDFGLMRGEGKKLLVCTRPKRRNERKLARQSTCRKA